jgi:hypothetical protein
MTMTTMSKLGIAMMVAVGCAGANALAHAMDGPAQGEPIILKDVQMERVTAGQLALEIGGTASAVSTKVLPAAIAITDSGSGVASAASPVSNTGVVAGAAVSLGIGDTSRSAQTSAEATLTDPHSKQVTTVSAGAGPIAESITVAVGIGGNVLGLH